MSLLDESTQARLDRARDGQDESVRLRLGSLEPGRVGVVEATVVRVAPARAFQRRRGGEGTLRRVTLEDGSGEADLVLWDDEGRFVRDGPLLPGARVRLGGPTVKEGYRGGVELHLGACVPVALGAPAERVDLEGVVEAFGDTEPVLGDDGPRFRGEVSLRTDDGATALVVLWDGALKAVRDGGPGLRWALSGLAPHPALDGWFLGDGADVRPLDAPA